MDERDMTGWTKIKLIVRNLFVCAGSFAALAIGASLLFAQENANPSPTSQEAALYFEVPHAIGPSNSRFAQLLGFDDRLVLIYQTITRQTDEGGTISITARSGGSGADFGPEVTVAQNIPFIGGTPPLLFSAARHGSRELLVAYSSDAVSTNVARVRWTGSGQLEIGDETTIKSENEFTVVSPRIFTRPDGSAVMFATQNSGTNPNIIFSRSTDGQSWSGFSLLITKLVRNVNLNPTMASIGNTDYVFFQSLDFQTTQIYMKKSTDKGETWTDAELVTDFINPSDKSGDPNNQPSYNNVQPYVMANGDTLDLVWVRSLRNTTPQLWYASLDKDGKRRRNAEQVSQSSTGAFNPILFLYQGLPRVVWFSSSQRGSRIFMSSRNVTGEWDAKEMSANVGTSSYPAISVFQDRIHIVFHLRLDDTNDQIDQTRIFYLEPDRRAAPPKIVGTNFTDGQRANRESLTLNLQAQPDASGIVGFAFAYGMDPNTPVPKQKDYAPGASVSGIAIAKNGTYYLRARSLDRAGNWSEPVTITYTLDTTPTDPVTFNPIMVDEEGNLVSNTFSLSWNPPPQDDFANYEWSLQYIGNLPRDEAETIKYDPATIPVMGTQKANSISRTNVENGAYLLFVWAIDSVGNRSAPRTSFLFANKYIPSTTIGFVDLRQDALGNQTLNIAGRGFTANGTIVRIVLDRDGKEPYDYEYFLNRGDYTVSGDRNIAGVKLDNLKTASYVLGLEHSERGFDFDSRRLSFTEHGVIQFGDFTLRPSEEYKTVPEAKFSIPASTIVIALVMILLTVLGGVAIIQMRNVMVDARNLVLTAQALLSGSVTPIWDIRRKAAAMKRQGLGLRFKFTLFFLVLVIIVVLSIALPLSNFTLANQRAVLAQGLQDRLNVLQDSLVASSRNLLDAPENYGVELSLLPSQAKGFVEINYVTLTGKGIGDNADYETVWATSDQKINGDEQTQANQPQTNQPESTNPVLKRAISPASFVPGRNSLTDVISEQTKVLRDKFDKEARDKLGTIPTDLTNYGNRIRELALNTTQEAKTESQQASAIRAKLNTQMSDLLATMAAAAAGSYPAYDPAHFDENVQDYVFYKPVSFRKAGEATTDAHYYQGMIRLGVSTAPIVEKIKSTETEILRTIILFSLLAIAGGIVGAIVLSSVTVNPIKLLVSDVQKISDAIGQSLDKQIEAFAKMDINVRTGDELQTLGSTINDMVHGLHKAAEANKDLTAGKEIQKMFIPLHKIGNEKGTTGDTVTEFADIFGYYEGAKGVSGDYFYYQKVSKDTFAFIKCDVAGKGIPAALIMVEVATLFLNHFEDWERKEIERRRTAASKGGTAVLSDTGLAPLVRVINDLIAEREFTERFAALNIVLLNERTGECVMCNAGDNLLHTYRADKGKMETVRLSISPAAGRFSTKEFPNISFKEDRNQLHFGDILMLYTDGLEESQRKFRNTSFDVAPLTEADIATAEFGEDFQPGVTFEEFGQERISAVVEAVQHHETYSLTKRRNPVADEELTFDFTTLKGTTQDTVMAMIAVEKVFRLIPNPKAGPGDRILIDKKVDDFLKEHFLQYRSYFRYERTDVSHNLYREYTHMMEESQYDDLTVLAVRKQ